jgi:hypothetical protein
MKSILAVLAAALVFCPAALGEPIDDARAIVDLTTDDAKYEVMFDALGDLMLGSLQNELTKSGKIISDNAAQVYVKMLTSHMSQGLTESMREPLAEAYVANLSSEALAGYRVFLESEAGQEVTATQGLMIQESTKIGQDVAVPIAVAATKASLADMEAGKWPDGTLKTTQNELLSLLELSPVSEEPPER